MDVVPSSTMEADVGALLETRVGDQPTHYSEILTSKEKLAVDYHGHF